MNAERFEQLCDQNKVNVENITNPNNPFHNIKEKVKGLVGIPGGLEFHLIADDSGSMDYQDPGEPQKRYLEQRDRLTEIAEFALALDPESVFLHTLNGEKNIKVTESDTVYNVLSVQPGGCTPLYDTLKPIFEREKTKIIFIGTDGGPTNQMGKDDKKRFTDLVMNRDAERNRLVFLPCIGNDTNSRKSIENDTNDTNSRKSIENDTNDTYLRKSLDYLNEFDDVPYVDVIDDYKTESKKILEDYKMCYTKGLHILRTFAAPFYPQLDNLNGR